MATSSLPLTSADQPRSWRYLSSSLRNSQTRRGRAAVRSRALLVVTGGGSFRPAVVVLEERRQFLRPTSPGTIATTPTNTTAKRDVANVAAVVIAASAVRDVALPKDSADRHRGRLAVAPEHVGPRRDAASAGRQFEKCTAGAAYREGTDSPLTRGSPGCPTDCAPALGPPKPKRAS